MKSLFACLLPYRFFHFLSWPIRNQQTCVRCGWKCDSRIQFGLLNNDGLGRMSRSPHQEQCLDGSVFDINSSFCQNLEHEQKSQTSGRSSARCHNALRLGLRKETHGKRDAGAFHELSEKAE